MARDKPENDRAPMCPICEHRHWNREPHVFKRKAKNKEVRHGKR